MPGNPIPDAVSVQQCLVPSTYCVYPVCVDSVLPPISPCYHSECERLATTGAQRRIVFGFCHHYILLEYNYVYNYTYTLQYVLLQYNVFYF
jgi:hypothetical protein